MAPYDWANGDSVDAFWIMSMILLLWGVDVTPGNRYGTRGKNYVALFQGSEMSAGFHYRGLILGMDYFRLINPKVY